MLKVPCIIIIPDVFRCHWQEYVKHHIVIWKKSLVESVLARIWKWCQKLVIVKILGILFFEGGHSILRLKP